MKKTPVIKIQKKGFLIDPEFKNIYQIKRTWNNKKIMKLFINWQFKGFIKFWKKDRELYIDNFLWDIILQVDY